MIGSLGTNFIAIWITLPKSSFEKLRLRMSSCKRKVFHIDLNVLRHSDLLYSVVGRTYQWVGVGSDKNKLMYTVIGFAGHHRRKTQDRSCKLISWILYSLNRIMVFISIDIPISFNVQVHDTYIFTTKTLTSHTVKTHIVFSRIKL